MRIFLVVSSILVGLCTSPSHAQVAIPDTGWKLWPDTQATWKDDPLYLPDEVDLTKLPVNPPTGGWPVLNDAQGTPVTLPSTVEQHDWGKFGFRPYQHNYTFASTDKDVQNGNYEGVSWWWRDLDVPADFAHKVVLLHIRGARQRAEVYLNHQLVGYDLIAETAFTCDVSKAVLPGQKNQLAIRITNPGGWMDWQDFQFLTWGKYTFQESHGFGGLDRGLTLEAHDPVYLADTWVLNTPDVRTITAHATLHNTLDHPVTGTVTWAIIDPAKSSASVGDNPKQTVIVPAHGEKTVSTPLTAKEAELWDLATPRLYSLQTHWESADASPMHDDARRTFGFRWFEPKGIGSQAGLYLNGRRVRLFTAISWGFWGLNGLWPTPDLAKKEVQAAKQLNMNCLNFHRDIGKEEVLAAQDRLGLLRYMEPGGGRTVLKDGKTRGVPEMTGPVDTSGKGGVAQSFAEKYETEKVLRMIRQFRSHPSLVIYVLQNEIDPDFHDPRVFQMLREMHAEDPSRVIAAKSGIDPTHQAFFKPYDDTLYHDDGTGYSGWRDEHTVGGPGVWTDDLYKDPAHFTHQSDDRKEIVDWGEMLGSATPDNHPLMIRQITAAGGASYDLTDHQEIAAAYDQFLDQWHFRTAFPTSEALFSAIGDKSYEFWGRVIETARLSEANDILTMSGWESTAIENHSGLVDNLRNFKGNPELIRAKLAPLLPVVKTRGTVFREGDQPLLDLYLLNETGQPAEGQLDLTLTDPHGKSTPLVSVPAPAYVKDQFVYPVQMGRLAPKLDEEGEYRLDFSLSESGKVVAKNTETLYCVRVPQPATGSSSTVAPDHGVIKIGVVGDMKEADKELSGLSNLSLSPYDEKGTYDLVAAWCQTRGTVNHNNDGSKIQNTEDDTLYRNSIGGKPGEFELAFKDLPKGPVRVSLYFADPSANATGQRVFSLVINGKTVLKDFDIFAESGGKNTAIVKTFTVDAPQGTLEIVPKDVLENKSVGPNLRVALVNAVKIEAPGKIVAVCCGGSTYTDKTGLVWQPYLAPDSFPASLIGKIKSGTPLLLLLKDEAAAAQTAPVLANAGAFHYTGTVGSSRAPWMGSWVFLRDHPVYAGLPTNTVMKGYYQVPAGGQCGLLVDGPGVDVIAAYSRDHDRHIGAATFTAKLGQGTLLVQTVHDLQPVMEERWMSNAISYLVPPK